VELVHSNAYVVAPSWIGFGKTIFVLRYSFLTLSLVVYFYVLRGWS